MPACLRDPLPVDRRPTTSGVAATPAVRQRPVLWAVCLALFVAQLDTVVVNLATRSIGESLGAGVAALQWVVDSYNLVYTVLLLTGGILADVLGRRRVFVTGAVIFTAASVLCAQAPTVGWLIAGRALTGVGSALMLPASLAVIRVVWPDPVARGRVLGIWAASNGLAATLAPTVGGVLIERSGWPSIFYLAVPFGVAAALLAMKAMPESRDPRPRSLDLPAQALGALALGALAWAAIATHGSPVMAMASAAVAVLALAGFLWIEARQGEGALLPLSLFRQRAFTAAVLTTAAMTFGMYGVLFLVPLTWQETGRFQASAAGLALVPMAISFLIVSPFSGALVGRLGPRVATTGGVGLIACGLLMLGWRATDPGIALTSVALLLSGVGMGVATGPLMNVAVGAVSPERSGTAGSMINVARMAGATTGVAVLGSIAALAGGAEAGMRAAMLVGGGLQLLCLALAWRLTAGQR